MHTLLAGIKFFGFYRFSLTPDSVRAGNPIRLIMAHKKKLPPDPVTAGIESLTHDGRGVARVDGKVVFIDEALPGETVEFVYTDSRREYAEGKVVKLLTRAPQRIEPACPHFGSCGGCSFQHVADAEQIKIKEGLLKEQFSASANCTYRKYGRP